MIGGRRLQLVAAFLCLMGSPPLLAQVQTSDQRKCITAMNDAAAKVARTQLTVATKCLRDAAKGKLPAGQSAQQCLTADNKGKIAKATGKTTQKDGVMCTAPLPDFGYTGAATANAAAIAGGLGTFASLYGADLDAAVIAADVDMVGALCQAAIAKGTTKVLAAMLGELRACKKSGLIDETVVGATDLELCLDAIDADAKGKIAKALTKLDGKLATICAGTTQATVAPGDCAAAPDLSVCIENEARCRACETFNAADDIERDCDLFDDGAANASCSAPTNCIDNDGDMYGTNCGLGPDCDDDNANINPAAAELCNNADDDCDTLIDEFAEDVGTSCGANATAPCSFGTNQCVGGTLMCFGNVEPKTETCNGVDDDCDGNVDLAGSSQPADSVGSCNTHPAPPPGATAPCSDGTKACIAGVVRCQGGTGPSSTTDSCNVDANCDGSLSNQPDTQIDVANCGTCGNNCYAGAVHSRWLCNSGTCQRTGCDPGYYDLDGNGTCEYPCTFISAQESCNGIDDNCDGQIDESITPPSPLDVCGVSPNAAGRAECTTSVTRSCVFGAWQCTFPAGVCNGPGGCSGTPEICDSVDNNCNGQVNENIAGYGNQCEAGTGLCRMTGTMICNGPNAVQCSAIAAPCATLPGGCTELCDGLDNDCDGSTDETFNNKGTNVAFFVKPTVTKVTANQWIHTYEASRPNATNITAGSGNGYYTAAPAGTTLDKTPACSVPSKIPWFNVTGLEADQTCAAMGGFVCSPAQWQTAARAKTASCLWGYSPDGSACTTAALPNPPNNPGKYCNLALTYDYSPASGRQEGVLPTGSALLSQCAADWSNVLGNTGVSASLKDITGNLREITKVTTNQYRLLGGSYPTESEDSARYDFTNYLVDQSFKLYDTGFRCCFSQDPTQ